MAREDISYQKQKTFMFKLFGINVSTGDEEFSNKTSAFYTDQMFKSRNVNKIPPCFELHRANLVKQTPQIAVANFVPVVGYHVLVCFLTTRTQVKVYPWIQ
ncbi:hypothetical protein L1887_07181 [Cichorium endivia]|nr:hypothetical protein L1887_07181 [Cichorium endivia]